MDWKNIVYVYRWQSDIFPLPLRTAEHVETVEEMLTIGYTRRPFVAAANIYLGFMD